MYVFCNAVTDCYDGSDEDLAVCEGGKILRKLSFLFLYIYIYIYINGVCDAYMTENFANFE